MSTHITTEGPRRVMHKLGLTATILAFVTAAGTYAAFTATTINSGSSVTSGTVDIDQHASAAAVVLATGLRPTTTVDATTGAKERCIRITYSGSIDADLKFYLSTGAITNGDKYNLKIERGTGLTTPNAAMSCTGFASPVSIYNGDLGAVTAVSWATGFDGKAGAATWTTGNTVDYKFTISAKDDPTANAHEQSPLENFPTSTHSFTWEARSIA